MNRHPFNRTSIGRWRLATLSAVSALTLSIVTVACNAEEDLSMTFQLRHRAETASGSGAYTVVFRNEVWKPSETAVIVCDMWDAHHSINATGRVGELAPRMNEVLKEARRRGATIIHAPSSCMAFYKDHPARQRVASVPKTKSLPDQINQWCHSIPAEEKGTYPLDQSDGGIDDVPAERAQWHKQLTAKGRNAGAPWIRQIDILEIDPEKDYITDDGVENWSILEHLKIKNVIVLGVHTNMCVLGRPFGLRQMAKNGKNVVLMRDMTDTMYNPAKWPYVNHFSGTDIIVEHIEKFVCPSITSDQLIGGVPFRFQGDDRPHVAVVIGESEYHTSTMLPTFTETYLKRDCKLTYMIGDDDDRTHIPNLDELKTADVMMLSVHRRALPKQELAAIRGFIQSGRAVVAFRTSSHAFGPHGDHPTTGDFQTWETFDREVLGGFYQGHHGNRSADEPTFVWVSDRAKSHPILRGLPSEPWRTTSWLYKHTPLGEGATPLMMGRVADRDPVEPVAWIYTNKHGGKVFYTMLGHPDEFKDERFTRLLRNGTYWACGLEIPEDMKVALPAK